MEGYWVWFLGEWYRFWGTKGVLEILDVVDIVFNCGWLCREGLVLGLTFKGGGVGNINFRCIWYLGNC